MRAGFNIQNLGPKNQLWQQRHKQSSPANLKVGTDFDFYFDDYNKVGS
jgi:hypothetical protein